MLTTWREFVRCPPTSSVTDTRGSLLASASPLRSAAVQLSLGVLSLVAVAVLLPTDNLRAQPTPERPADELLSTPRLQTLVEAQVERDADGLISALDADDSSVRARAAFALGSVQDTSAIPSLLSLLTDGVPSVRTDAVFALSHMPQGVPSEKLLQVLRYERDPSMQQHLIAALGRTGDASSLDELVALRPPDRRDPDVALAFARYAARGIVNSSATDWLLDHLTSNNAETRVNAAYAFGRLDTLAHGHASTIRQALDAYASNDPAAMHLLRALGRRDDSADRDRLTEWLHKDETDWRTRVEAARGLGGRDTAAVHASLLKALRDDHPLVARTAAEALANGDWNSSTTTAVEVWLSAHPDRWRIIAPLLRGLARHDHHDTVMNTISRWRANRSNVAYASALAALAPIDRPQADSLLHQGIRASDPHIASAAVQAVRTRWTRVQPKDASKYLKVFSAALRTGDPNVIYHTAPVLSDSLFVVRGATDTLASTFQSLSVPDDLEGMTAVLKALSAIGDSTAETVLQSALDHPHPTIRTTAATGFSSVRDTTIKASPHPLPETPALDWDALKKLGPHPELVLSTNRGTVTIRLDTEQAPQTVQAISRFVRNDRYDGVPFHRVVPNFVVQGGDFVRRDGFGGPGFFLRTEITHLGHQRGTLGMASAGKNTEGSQFFIPHSRQPHLDGSYTSFGRVVDGMTVVDRIRMHDRIQEATVRPTESTSE